MKVVNREQPDLLVTGTKGRSAVTRFLQGSVSMKLAQLSACSVLVVRSVENPSPYRTHRNRTIGRL
jgi:nucleotide-binding universal stress UspA family protein